MYYNYFVVIGKFNFINYKARNLVISNKYLVHIKKLKISKIQMQVGTIIFLVISNSNFYEIEYLMKINEFNYLLLWFQKYYSQRLKFSRLRILLYTLHNTVYKIF